MIAESASMRAAVTLGKQLAGLDLPVLIVGPTGTGKEVLAQAIHRWSGRPGPMVDVDCGAFPPGMIVPELFGHRRGAYTGAFETVPGLIERAHRGTLFLDELGSLPIEGQSSLIRVLETRQVRRLRDTTHQVVDLRLIAAVQDVAMLRLGGGFREDLYQRLAGAVISLQPLSARPEDLLPLARHFAEPAGGQVLEEAGAILKGYSWPGNVRELRHTIARAMALSPDKVLHSQALSDAIGLGASGAPRNTPTGKSKAVVQHPQEVEILAKLCQTHGGNTALIASALGVSRATLFRRLKEVGLTVRQLRRSGTLQEVMRRLETA